MADTNPNKQQGFMNTQNYSIFNTNSNDSLNLFNTNQGQQKPMSPQGHSFGGGNYGQGFQVVKTQQVDRDNTQSNVNNNIGGGNNNY